MYIPLESQKRKRQPVCLPAILFLLLVCLSCGGGSGSGPAASGSSEPPVILSLSPDKGHVTGGVHVRIKGKHFVKNPDTMVYFGESAATEITVLDPGTISCLTPPYAQGSAIQLDEFNTVDVSVTSSEGKHTLANAFTYQSEHPSILWFNYTKDRNVLDFSWELTSPGESIVFYRGCETVAVLDGNAKKFHYEEQQIGLYRYTVALYLGGKRVDQRDLLIHLGRVVWTPPASGDYSGFYLYLVETGSGDPYELLPYDDPSNFSYDARMNNEVDLIALYFDNLIKGNTSYYLAASTYLIEGFDVFISKMTEPIEFYCAVSMAEP